MSDLTGQVFGRLTVVKKVAGGKNSKWLCECSCPSRTRIIVERPNLGTSTLSCGCYQKEKARQANIGNTHSLAHGHARVRRRTLTYSSWNRMLQRCTNPNEPRFEKYGGGVAPVLLCE